MAIVSIETLKSYFETGDKPTELQFIDLIDTLASLPANGNGNANITSILVAAIQTLRSTSALSTVTFYNVTNAVGGTKVLQVYAIANNTNLVYAVDVATGQGGIYNITTDSFTPSSSSPVGDPYSVAVYDSAGDLSTSFNLSDSSGTDSIGVNNRILYDENVNVSLDWNSYLLYDPLANPSLDWANRVLRKSDGSTILDWENDVIAIGNFLPLAGGSMDTSAEIRWAENNTGIGVGLTDQGTGGSYGISLYCSVDYELNWQAGDLTSYEAGGTGVIRPLYLNSDLSFKNSMRIVDTTLQASIDPEYRILIDANNFTSIDYGTRNMRDALEIYAIDYAARLLHQSDGGTAFDWENRTMYDFVGAKSIDAEQRELYDFSGNIALSYLGRTHYDSSGISSLAWEDRLAINSLGTFTIDWESMSLYDNIVETALDWRARTLNSQGVARPTLAWQDAVAIPKTVQIGNNIYDGSTTNIINFTADAGTDCLYSCVLTTQISSASGTWSFLVSINYTDINGVSQSYSVSYLTETQTIIKLLPSGNAIYHSIPIMIKAQAGSNISLVCSHAGLFVPLAVIDTDAILTKQSMTGSDQ